MATFLSLDTCLCPPPLFSTMSDELLQACRDGDLRRVRSLVEERHVDPQSCRDKECHNSALHWASVYDHLPIVRYLVEERNCDVESRNKYGDAPVHRAAFGGGLKTVQYLISKRGCSPMCKGWQGRSPLHCACQKGSLDVVRYLVEDLNVNPSSQDDNEVTPLHMAAQFGSLQVVQYMIEKGNCDVECRSKFGDTPLHHAAYGGKLETVKYIVDIRRYDPTCKAWEYRTPLDWAQDEGHSHITAFLSSVLCKTLVAELKCYTRKATPTGVELGSGAYGSVVELNSAGEIVAGKVFKISSTACLQAIPSKMCGELILMAQLHHPHIVAYKGVAFLPEQTLPVLLMERLMSNLQTYLLDPNHCSLMVERKLSILCQVACGLSFLHSRTPAIIHRDLTAKNVLLDLELVAKIADFGNARIMDLDPEASPESLTCGPGTLEYMPPEAQEWRSRYDTSLDVFSFGHLSLFTITQTPVRPLLSPTYSNDQGELCARSEVKRRQEFVKMAENLLPEKRPLTQLIKECLHNTPSQRPHTKQLLARLQDAESPGKEIDASILAMNQVRCVATQSTSGKNTGEYKRLLANLDRITRNLQSHQNAYKTLTRKVKEKKWIDITYNPSEEELVVLVLEKVKLDSAVFQEFAAILREIDGLQPLANRLFE